MDNRHLYNYNYYHQSRNFQTKPERTEKMVKKVLEHKPNSVLDVGCGLGAIVNKLCDEGLVQKAIGTDFSEDLIGIWGKNHLNRFLVMDARDLLFANNSFDLVVSSDFFEHINEADIDKVALEMKRVGKKVITFVADDRGMVLTEKQKEYHVTHKPLSWWKNKLKNIEVFSSHDYES